MTLKVSVVLPTFNRAKSLTAAAESVLRQSFRQLELIIVDDGSSEDIASVARSLDDPRVRYLRRRSNGGAAAARNTGLTVARGEFVAFQDSDDLWLPGKLERQLALFASLPDDVGVVFGSKILYGRDSNYNYGPGLVACAPPPQGILRLDEDQTRAFLTGNRLSLQNALFRRNCYPEPIWFDPCAKANEDWEFAARLAQHVRLYEDRDPVVVAFISADSISTGSRKKALGLMRLLKRNRAAYDRYPDLRNKHLISIARALYKIGKRRCSIQLTLSVLRKNPKQILPIIQHAALHIIKRQRHLLNI